MSTPLPPLDTTLGVTLIGVIFSSMLLGIAAVQTFIFVKTNKQIRYINKFTTILLLTLDATHILFSSHVIYHYLVTKQGNIISTPLTWSFTASVSLDIILTNFTEILYSFRLWQLCNSNRGRNRVFVPVAAMILLDFGLNIYIPWQVSRVVKFIDLGQLSWKTFLILYLSVSTFVDLYLCLALAYTLSKKAKRLDWAETNATVLSAYAMNTGALATVFSLCSLITYVLMPTTFVFMAFRVILCGLYVNSLLAMLNARFYFQHPEGLVNIALPHGSVFLYNRGHANPIPENASTNNNLNVTINEAGLPLFPPSSQAGRRTAKDIQLVEVKVTKEQIETTENQYHVDCLHD